MKILVTGGAGFIGSHLLLLLAQRQNIETVVYDNLTGGVREFVPEGMKLVVGDVRDARLEEVFASEHFDACIHLAAQTMVPYSLQHPDEDCDINLRGIIHVLECCRQYDVNKVIFSSSAAVYGDSTNIPLREEERPLPTSFYGLTKLTSEHYMRLYHDLYGLDTTVLRFANVYGERQGNGGEGGVISIFCKLLAAGQGVTLYGDGTQTRDFVYAGDVARAILHSLSLTGHQVINVSMQQETSLNELLDTFAQAVGHTFPVTHEPSREGDIYRSVLSHDRCRQYFGWVPSMDLQQGIKQTYADYVGRLQIEEHS